MKAIFFRHYGGSEVLEYSDTPEPLQIPDEVFVRLRTASLNRLDAWIRSGCPGIKLTYPHIPGADGAGEISELGPRVVDWKIGDCSNG